MSIFGSTLPSRVDGTLVNISAQVGQKVKLNNGTVVLDIQRTFNSKSDETAVVLISLQYESGVCVFFFFNLPIGSQEFKYEGLQGGEGGSLFPCSLPKLSYVPMFPHSLRMFSYCDFSNFVPRSQKIG